MQAFDSKTNVPEERLYQFRIQGAAAADPVSVPSAAQPGLFSQGFASIKRTAAGRYTFTWRDNPGLYVGLRGKPTIADVTPGNVKNMDVVLVSYTNANGVFAAELDVYSSAGALTDLAATNFLSGCFVFKATQG